MADQDPSGPQSVGGLVVYLATQHPKNNYNVLTRVAQLQRWRKVTVSSAIFGGTDVVILTAHRRKRSHVCRDKIVSQLS